MSRRLFVAAWLDETSRAEVADLVVRLRSAAPEAALEWVPPDNLHVTLRFLGDVAEDRVEGLVRSLERSLVGATPFALALGGVGTFPPLSAVRSGRAPRVLWVGVESGGRELAALVSRVERAALAAGVVDAIDPRPFRAHVTLGRFRSEPRGFERMSGLLEEATFRGGMRSLDEVTLVESRLTPRGATYEAVARFSLVGDGSRTTELPTEGDEG